MRGAFLSGFGERRVFHVPGVGVPGPCRHKWPPWAGMVTTGTHPDGETQVSPSFIV